MPRCGTITAALVLSALVASAFGAAGVRAGEVLDRVKADGVLKMSTDPEYPPQSSLDAMTNEFVGFDIDVGREIARRLGVEIAFVTPGWDVVIAGRWAGRWDMSVGSMTPTKERAQVLDFPGVYYFTPASLVVNAANETIAEPADASGKQIGVGQATTYENYLKKDLVIDVADAPPFDYVIDDPVIRTYETDLLALDDLRLGDGVRLDAALTALPTILDAIARGYPLKLVGEPLFKEPLAVAIEKGDPEFLAELTRIVDEMKADGTLVRLSEQYYGVDLSR